MPGDDPSAQNKDDYVGGKFVRILYLWGIGIVLFFAFSVGQLTAALDHGRWMTGTPAPSERLEPPHLAEAIQYRSLDRVLPL